MRIHARSKSKDESETDEHSSALLSCYLMRQAVNIVTPVGEKHRKNVQEILKERMVYGQK